MYIPRYRYPTRLRPYLLTVRIKRNLLSQFPPIPIPPHAPHSHPLQRLGMDVCPSYASGPSPRRRRSIAPQEHPGIFLYDGLLRYSEYSRILPPWVGTDDHNKHCSRDCYHDQSSHQVVALAYSHYPQSLHNRSIICARYYS